MERSPVAIEVGSQQSLGNQAVELRAGQRDQTLEELEAGIVGLEEYRMSVAATAVFADALVAHARGETFRTGVFGIERIVRLAEAAPALAARGITVEPLGQTPANVAVMRAAASGRRA